MADPIEFWFDFSSPYAYFAQAKIDDIGARHGRETIWRPFLLGAVFKITGMPPLVEVPMKGEYCLEDWPRLARFQHLPWTMPDPFPIATIAAARAFYWLDETDPAKAKSFARACFDTYFGQGIQVGKPDEVAAVAEGVGVDGAALLEAASQCRGCGREADIRLTDDHCRRRAILGLRSYLDGQKVAAKRRLVMALPYQLRDI